MDLNEILDFARQLLLEGVIEREDIAKRIDKQTTENEEDILDQTMTYQLTLLESIRELQVWRNKGGSDDKFEIKFKNNKGANETEIKFIFERATSTPLVEDSLIERLDESRIERLRANQVIEPIIALIALGLFIWLIVWLMMYFDIEPQM